MRGDVLVAEISGKRPGDVKARPTENIKTRYDHIIVSNNSEGYITNWDIVNVPTDYEMWYREKYGFAKAWQAPMNRSYAIKLAKERGYRYLVQVDDNIIALSIRYKMKGEPEKAYNVSYGAQKECFDDFVAVLIEALRRSNAGMAGMDLQSVDSSKIFCAERFVYSFFALDLARVPEIFHANFEDDIQFRLRLREMGVPVISLPVMAYGKTSSTGGDKSGCRQAYADVGLGRGEVLRKIHGEHYSCGIGRKMSTKGKQLHNEFQHRLKPFKVGVMTRDWDRLEHKFLALLRKHARFCPSATIETCE